jgi:large subunit ribosomal protein L25
MELKVQHRTILGKKIKVLRQQGMIPAELYGRDFENTHLSVPEKDFSRIFKEAGESTVIKLILDGKEFNVLINDFQENPLTNKISHVDFYQVRMDEKITASVPLVFVGEAPAVKEQGGILIKSMHEIEVEALPAALPHHIEVDVANLSDIGASVYVKDLKVNKDVKLLVEPETVVATVSEAAKEEVVAGPASVEEVKVEGEEKRKEKEGESQ